MMTPQKILILTALLCTPLLAVDAFANQNNGAQAPAPANPYAQQLPPPPPRPGLPFSNFLSDDEMGMLFDYLRDSFIATMRNDPEGASMPPELAFKLEILKQRMIKEGDAYVRQLMQSMQQDLDRALKEYNQQLPQHQQPPLPPAPPAQPQPAPGTPSRT